MRKAKTEDLRGAGSRIVLLGVQKDSIDDVNDTIPEKKVWRRDLGSGVAASDKTARCVEVCANALTCRSRLVRTGAKRNQVARVDRRPIDDMVQQSCLKLRRIRLERRNLRLDGGDGVIRRRKDGDTMGEVERIKQICSLKSGLEARKVVCNECIRKWSWDVNNSVGDVQSDVAESR